MTHERFVRQQQRILWLQQRILWLRQRFIPKVRPQRRREVRRILAGTLWLMTALSVGWAVTTDIEDRAVPLDADILFYALSTLAQVAAALAALIGFFGLWQLDRLREQQRRREEIQHDIERDMMNFRRRQLADSAASDLSMIRGEPAPSRLTFPDEQRRLEQRLTTNRRYQELFQSEQRRLRRALWRFLLATLAILALAIASLAFVDVLRGWVWTARLLIILTGVCLAIGPASVIREVL